MAVLPLIALAPTSCESKFKTVELICGSGDDSSPCLAGLVEAGSPGHQPGANCHVAPVYRCSAALKSRCFKAR